MENLGGSKIANALAIERTAVVEIIAEETKNALNQGRIDPLEKLNHCGLRSQRFSEGLGRAAVIRVDGLELWR
jgi:hypothetical protein